MVDALRLSPVLSGLLVACGSILGACLRFQLVRYFIEKYNKYRLGTLFVNCSATFALGALTSFNNRINNASPISSWMIFLGLGFLGTYSTFSSFIVELLEELRMHSFRKFFLLAACSIFGGLFSAFWGYVFAGIIPIFK